MRTYTPDEVLAVLERLPRHPVAKIDASMTCHYVMWELVRGALAELREGRSGAVLRMECVAPEDARGCATKVV